MFEPAGRARFVGLMWIAVAVMLYARSASYFVAVQDTAKQAGLLAVALVIGGAKGWFVLRKSSKRLITRIESMPGKQGVWTIWHPVFIVLIALMIGFGVALRKFAGPTYPSVVVLVYFGVGAALAVSSIHFFQAAGRLAAGQPAFEEAARLSAHGEARLYLSPLPVGPEHVEQDEARAQGAAGVEERLAGGVEKRV